MFSSNSLPMWNPSAKITTASKPFLYDFTITRGLERAPYRAFLHECCRYPKFAAYPRQQDLALALREIGRIERTLFIIDWLLDAELQRRAQSGPNKGEAHHALKNALRIGRQGEIRDRTTEGQHFRIAGLNLLAAIVIYWNTLHIGHAVAQRQSDGLSVPPELLAHISPLGWAHILLTGEYRWPRTVADTPYSVI